MSLYNNHNRGYAGLNRVYPGPDRLKTLRKKTRTHGSPVRRSECQANSLGMFGPSQRTSYMRPFSRHIVFLMTMNAGNWLGAMLPNNSPVSIPEAALRAYGGAHDAVQRDLVSQML